MKKPFSLPEEKPCNIQRAGIPPTEGLMVDGHYKTQFDDQASAEAAAADLLTKFWTLKVEIYDAKKRSA
jgi:hypothetical protein